MATSATLGSRPVACEPWSTSKREIDYQQCGRGLGWQARCAEGYEGLNPCCGRDRFDLPVAAKLIVSCTHL